MHIKHRHYLNHYFDLFFHGKELYFTSQLAYKYYRVFLKKHYLHRAIIIVKLSSDDTLYKSTS